MLELKNFSFAFGEKIVLNDINFSIETGVFLHIIGPNGAGKSTLLKCLLRLCEQGNANGEIIIKGRPLKSYSQKKLARVFSYVPQAGGWIPPFKVREFLHLSRYAHSSLGRSDAHGLEMIEKALALTNLSGLAERPLRTLSGGERQKAFVAAALAQGAEIMLLDEASAFLDPKHARELEILLTKLNQRAGLTMLWVTHNLNQVMAAGGHALVLKSGSQLFFGPVEALSGKGILEAAYEHRFVHFPHPVTGRPAILAE